MKEVTKKHIHSDPTTAYPKKTEKMAESSRCSAAHFLHQLDCWSNLYYQITDI